MSSPRAASAHGGLGEMFEDSVDIEPRHPVALRCRFVSVQDWSVSTRLVVAGGRCRIRRLALQLPGNASRLLADAGVGELRAWKRMSSEATALVGAQAGSVPSSAE